MSPKIKSSWLQLTFFIIIASFALLLGCERESRGFALPKGDIEAGKKAFVKLSCVDCHSIADIEWRSNAENVHLPLGGEVPRIKTYGELVTSIINPSHKIAEGYEHVGTLEGGTSKMRNYNEVMSVQALVDIVTFLQSEYQLKVPPTYYYPY